MNEKPLIEAVERLTAAQESFCAHYARHWSVSEASRTADITQHRAYELLKLPKIQARIRELARDYSAEVHVEVGAILRELLQMAQFDPLTVMRDGVQCPALAEMPDYARKSIKELEFEERYESGADPEFDLPTTVRTVKVKFYGKEKALELLGKFRKLFGADEQAVETPRSVVVNIRLKGDRDEQRQTGNIGVAEESSRGGEGGEC